MENWNKLSDDEKARLRSRVPIAVDDPTAIGTAAGWAKRTVLGEERRDTLALSGTRVYMVRPKAPASVLEIPQAPTIPGHERRSFAAKMGMAYVEAERWADARAFGILLFGSGEVTCELAGIEDRNACAILSRWQLRWAGAGYTATLRLQARRLQHGAYGSATAKGETLPQWRDAREAA